MFIHKNHSISVAYMPLSSNSIPFRTSGTEWVKLHKTLRKMAKGMWFVWMYRTTYVCLMTAEFRTFDSKVWLVFFLIKNIDRLGLFSEPFYAFHPYRRYRMGSDLGLRLRLSMCMCAINIEIRQSIPLKGLTLLNKFLIY